MSRLTMPRMASTWVPFSVVFTFLLIVLLLVILFVFPVPANG